MTMHLHSHGGVVWYGGIGHHLLSSEGGSECYRCGMLVDDSALEELIPDCSGPDITGHHWLSDGRNGNECAYGDAHIDPDTETNAPSPCVRA